MVVIPDTHSERMMRPSQDTGRGCQPLPGSGLRLRCELTGSRVPKPG
jgi:hypothetical protein